MAVGVSVPGSRPNCLPSPRALSSVTSVCFTTRLINWNVSLRIEFGSIRSSPIVSAVQCAENTARHSCRFPIFPPHQAGRKLNKLYIIVACRAGPCVRAVLLFVWNLHCVWLCASSTRHKLVLVFACGCVRQHACIFCQVRGPHCVCLTSSVNEITTDGPANIKDLWDPVCKTLPVSSPCSGKWHLL